MSEDEITVAVNNKSQPLSRPTGTKRRRKSLTVAKGKFDAAELANVLADFENKLLLDRIKDLDQKINTMSREIAVLARCFVEQQHAMTCLSLSIDELVNATSSGLSDKQPDSDHSCDEIMSSGNGSDDGDLCDVDESVEIAAINVFVNIPKDWN